MKLGTIIFDINTDYAAVEIKLRTRLSELVAIQCGCDCSNDREDAIILQATKYLRVAKINLDATETIKYQNCIQQAYYELVKLDC